MKYDIVLAAIPKNDYRAPFIAPFLLKSILQNNGFTCKAVDWNRDLYERVDNKDLFNRNLTFNVKEKFDKVWDEQLKKICLKWIKELKSYNPKWFGISLISQRNEWMGRKILELVRINLPDTKIVIGGFMVGEGYRLGPKFFKEGLTDYFISGEGDDAIVNLLNGNYDFPGINTINTYKAVNLNRGYIADYSDVSHYNYGLYDIYNSRGCINNCLFCNENTYTHGYRFRKAELVVEEMKSIRDKYNNYMFRFVDSLINGNIKEFRKFINLIQNMNFNWWGYFLCRSCMIEEDFKKAASAGLSNISVGIESGSQRIRNEMKKRFNEKDIHNLVIWCEKYDIQISANIIVGWPTETEEDFQKTLDFLTFLAKHNRNLGVCPGATLQVGKESETFIKYDMISDENGKWVYKDNNYKLRKERWKRLIDHCENLKVVAFTWHKDRVEGKINGISA